MRDEMERATIETERTILRRYTEEDAEALYEIAKDPDVGPHAGWAPHESPAASLEIIRELFLKTDTFAVTDKETEKHLVWLVSTGHVVAFTNGVYSAVEDFPKYGPEWQKKTLSQKKEVAADETPAELAE